jgi:hypothetical protein
MSMLVWLTRCETVPCWLNGTPCAAPNDRLAVIANTIHDFRFMGFFLSTK